MLGKAGSVRKRCGKETVVMVVTMGAGEGRASERAVWEGDSGDGSDYGCWVSHGPVRQRCGKKTMVMVETMGAG